MDERRKNGGLTEAQYTFLKARLRQELKVELKSELYQELWDEVALRVGRTALSKILYVFWAAIAALAAWLAGSGHIKFPGAD